MLEVLSDRHGNCQELLTLRYAWLFRQLLRKVGRERMRLLQSSYSRQVTPRYES